MFILGYGVTFESVLILHTRVTRRNFCLTLLDLLCYCAHTHPQATPEAIWNVPIKHLRGCV